MAGALGLAYGWTHFLIRTRLPPQNPLYKAVWRNHRLHHYRNEHHWFTVTSAGTADRVLGTYPRSEVGRPVADRQSTAFAALISLGG